MLQKFIFSSNIWAEIFNYLWTKTFKFLSAEIFNLKFFLSSIFTVIFITKLISLNYNNLFAFIDTNAKSFRESTCTIIQNCRYGISAPWRAPRCKSWISVFPFSGIIVQQVGKVSNYIWPINNGFIQVRCSILNSKKFVWAFKQDDKTEIEVQSRTKNDDDSVR